MVDFLLCFVLVLPEGIMSMDAGEIIFHQTWKTKRSFLETTNHGAMMLSSFDHIYDSWFTSILNTSHILQGAQTSTKVCRNATKNSLQNSRNTAWGSNFGSEIGKSQDKSPVLLPPFKKRNHVNNSTYGQNLGPRIPSTQQQQKRSFFHPKK